MEKFCTNCGGKLEDHFNVCPYCGTQQGGNLYAQNYSQQVPVQEDKVEIGYIILGFFIPMAGLVLWALWSKEKPKTAKAVGIAGIIGFIAGIIFSILVYSYFYFTVVGEI